MSMGKMQTLCALSTGTMCSWSQVVVNGAMNVDWIHTVTKQINLRQKLFPSSPTTSHHTTPHSRDKCVKQQVSSLAQQWLIKRVGLFIRRQLLYTFPRNFVKTPGRDRASVKNFSRWFGNFCFLSAARSRAFCRCQI